MFKPLMPRIVLMMIVLLAACSGEPAVESPTAPSQTVEEQPATTTAASNADLAAIKQYALDNAYQMREGTSQLLASAEAYHDVITAHNLDYQAAWEASQEEATRLVAEAKAAWLQASQYYELDEGIIAGVPSLAFYDVWIDAGPSAEEAPAEAYAWTLELPDGRRLESPGNFFHSLLEPTIWGTKPEYTGLRVDLDGDGNVELGEAPSDAQVLLGAAQGLNQATAEMITTVEAWEPTLSDAFTALVVMIPTMNEYFEQWKLSAYVAGESAEEAAFIGASRLFDITNILHGLDVTYDNVSMLVAAVDPALHGQIEDGFVDLRGYVDNLYAQEQGGVDFAAEQVDLFGTQAQDKATALAGQVTQAAAVLNITLEE